MITNILRIVLLLATATSAVNGFLGKHLIGTTHGLLPIPPSALSSSTSTSEMVAEVKAGDKIPSVTLKEGLGDFQNREVNIADLIAGKKVALFGVPGAFTPGYV